MSTEQITQALHAFFTRANDDLIEDMLNTRRRIEYASTSAGVERHAILDMELRSRIQTALDDLTDIDLIYISQQFDHDKDQVEEA